jgi:D-alanyl-D-alanine carboxypeptidase (penicillin-binding protein 5/6)
VGESEIWLSPGEILSVEDLLYATLPRSANDASVALAEHVAGSEESFVQLMNQKAREIGAFRTNFVNATGLDAEEHLSTAYDLALIARYAMQNETFARIVATEERTISSAGHEDRVIKNLNPLLKDNAFITGVKTGFTGEAGWCMAASAIRDGKNLISIILGSENQDLRSEDVLAVLNYGFNNFERKRIIGQEVATFVFQPSDGTAPIKVAPRQDLSLLLPKDKEVTVTARYLLMQNISGHLDKGEKIGEISLWMGDDRLGQEDLVSLGQVSETQQVERGKATPEYRSASLSYPDYAVLAGFALLLLLSILRLLRLVLIGY